jgi:hypothetical protein
VAKWSEKERAPVAGGSRESSLSSSYFLVAVDVVVLDSVVVVVEPIAEGVVMAEGVVVMSVPVAVVLVVVVVAVVPVSSTTVGCSVVVVVSVVVSSFFLQPVTSAVANTATRPRVTSFFISLISFISLSASNTQKESLQKRGGMISQWPPLSTGRGPGRDSPPATARYSCDSRANRGAAHRR